MTNIKAVHTIGNSIISLLSRSFENEGKAETGVNSCTFELLSSSDLSAEDGGLSKPAVSLYLYRVTMNEHLRSRARPWGIFQGEVPLSLDLHYLLAVWADKPEEEHSLLAWSMQQLYLHPLLDTSLIGEDASWEQGDSIQIVPAELSTEDIMRIWDALQPSYRLSVTYIARVVRLDRKTGPDHLPVVASRFIYADQEDPQQP
jgi:hypothetical protein